eukprot:9590483-Alexandrium_andersonii.AAC.1
MVQSSAPSVTSWPRQSPSWRALATGWSAGASSSGSTRRQSSQMLSANTRSAGRTRASARPPHNCMRECRSGTSGAGSWEPREARRWTRTPESAPST